MKETLTSHAPGHLKQIPYIVGLQTTNADAGSSSVVLNLIIIVNINASQHVLVLSLLRELNCISLVLKTLFCECMRALELSRASF